MQKIYKTLNFPDKIAWKYNIFYINFYVFNVRFLKKGSYLLLKKKLLLLKWSKNKIGE